MRISWIKWVTLLIVEFSLFLVFPAFILSISLQSDNFIVKSVFIILGIVGCVFLFNRIRFAFENVNSDDLRMKGMVKLFVGGSLLSVLLFVFYCSIVLLFGESSIHINSGPYTFLIDACFTLLLAAISEEIVYRGVLFRMLDYKIGFIPALLLSSFLFGFSHISNPNATIWSSISISIGMGLLLAAIYKYSHCLWSAIGLHWAWNFIEGPILGTPVSGIHAPQSVFRLETVVSNLLTGDAFGPETSLPMVVMGFSLSLYYIYLILRNNEK